MCTYSALIMPTEIQNCSSIILLKWQDYQHALLQLPSLLSFLYACRKVTNVAFLKSISCGLYPALTNPPKNLVISINVARADLDLHLGWIMEFHPLHL